MSDTLYKQYGGTQTRPRFLTFRGQDGKHRPSGLMNPIPVGFGDSFSVDAFSRLRVSNPVTIFDSTNRYKDETLVWENDLTGSGTTAHTPNESGVDLDVTAANGDKVTRQTRQYFPYRPGKSQFILMTLAFGTGQTNTQKRAGYFDDANGIFLQEENGAVSIIRRSKVTGSVVDTEVAQADWSEDKLDGNGPSGVTLNPALAQLFFIDIEWLGVGRVRCGFFIDGVPIYTHFFNHGNITASSYMTTATLPVRYEIENTAGAASTSTFKALCCSIVSEGGFEHGFGFQFSASNAATPISVTTRRAILSIRPKTLFNSIANRGLIVLEKAAIFAQTEPAFFEVVFGGTLGGTPSWNDANSNSMVEFDIAGTTVTGGISFSPGYADAGGNPANAFGTEVQADLAARLPLSLDISGGHPTSPYTDVISIVCTTLANTSSDTGILTWKELR